MSKNKHNLSRDIPEGIKRKVRQNSKFGCVMCDSAYYTYEHITPEYSDATEHDPDKICLLCPNHHALSTKGRLKKDIILQKYNEIRTKESSRTITDDDFFNFYSSNVSFNIGNNLFKDFKSIITIDGVNILSYTPMDTFPYHKISGIFYDDSGNELFKIENNEWIGQTNVWDIFQVGKTLTIKKTEKIIAFQAEKMASENTVKITKLDMMFSNFHILLNSKGLLIGQYSIDRKKSVYFYIQNSSFTLGSSAIDLKSDIFSEPKGFQIIGGEGLRIKGTGILLGHKSATMNLMSLAIRTIENPDINKLRKL